MLARQRSRVCEAAAWRGRFCVVLATMMLASGASAQERRVTGRVLRPAADTMRGVPGAWVVLHRVAADRSGPIDSTRTSREGGFAIRYIPSGTGDAIYFVSAEHHGIAYFSPPLDTGRAVEEAELAVFDTTSAPVPIHIRGHHIVVAAPGENGDREIVEVFELANDSSVTRVAAGEVPVWSTPLPDGATDVRIGQGDLSEDAIRTDGGRIRLYAPLAPGIKQLSYAYRLDGGAFPFSRPVEGRAGVLEVLLEEPDVTATAPGLERVDPVTVESRTFNRFLAQELPAAGVLRIDAPRDGVDARRALVLAILALAVGAMTLVLVRARRRPVPASPAGERRAERLAREIAELDARVEAAPGLEPAERETYARRRAELKRELASALDEERGDG